MNKEIEEIIKYFRNDIKWLEKELKNPHYLGYYITIRDKEYEYLKQLLDYITNLQEENKELKSLYDTPKKDKKIKRLGKCFFTDYDDIFTEWVATYNGVIVDKLNEIIDRLNGEE